MNLILYLEYRKRLSRMLLGGNLRIFFFNVEMSVSMWNRFKRELNFVISVLLSFIGKNTVCYRSVGRRKLDGSKSV